MLNPKKASILLVEPDRQARDLCHRGLAAEGFTVGRAETPQQAMGFATLMKFDLLVCDVFLESMLGRDLAGRLAAHQPELRVLLTSTYARGSLLHRDACPMGCALLTKPFAPAQLAAKAKVVLAYSRRWAEVLNPPRAPAFDEESLSLPA